jgi:hypothetical protein
MPGPEPGIVVLGRDKLASDLLVLAFGILATDIQ